MTDGDALFVRHCVRKGDPVDLVAAYTGFTASQVRAVCDLDPMLAQPAPQHLAPRRFLTHKPPHPDHVRS